MTELQAKRSQADDNGTVGTPSSLAAIVESFSHDQLKSLLLKAAQKEHHVSVRVREIYEANPAAERIKVAAERAPQAKRSQADDDGTVGAPSSLAAIVESFSHDQMKSLLLEAAPKHHRVLVRVRDIYEANLAAERIKVAPESAETLLFSDELDNVSDNIHEKYKNLSGSELLNKAGEVSMLIDNTIKSIAEQAGTTTASAGTRMFAMEGLCQIVEDIFDEGSPVAAEVRKDHQHGDTMVGSMKKIVKAMNNEERFLMRWVKLPARIIETRFSQLLDELIEHADKVGCFKGMNDVLGMLEEKNDADNVVEDKDDENDQGEGDDLRYNDEDDEQSDKK